MNDSTIQVSWKQIDELVEKIARDIATAGFKPDLLIGITVGGLIPLALLAKKLGVRDVTTISAASYADMQQGAIAVSNIPSVDMKDRNVLLVDEIADTGETLRGVIKILQTKCNANILKAATLIVRTDKCKTRPDFFALEADRWVVFPWD